MSAAGLKGHFELMARYNQWMNDRILTLIAENPDADFTADRGAFFGSVWGTLNHLLVTDIIWLTRLHGHLAGALLAPVLNLPRPRALDDILFDDPAAFAVARRELDALLTTFVASLDDDALTSPLSYCRFNGDVHTKTLGPVLSHVFSHQTHHRGQITTLLSQMGLDIGVTDVLVLIPEADSVN